MTERELDDAMRRLADAIVPSQYPSVISAAGHWVLGLARREEALRGAIVGAPAIENDD